MKLNFLFKGKVVEGMPSPCEVVKQIEHVPNGFFGLHDPYLSNRIKSVQPRENSSL